MQEVPGIEDDRLVVGMQGIVAEVFDDQITVRQGYREIQKPDLGAFKVLGKHALFVRRAREALGRRSLNS